MPQEPALLTVQEEARRAGTEYAPPPAAEPPKREEAGQPKIELDEVNALLKERYGKTLDDLIPQESSPSNAGQSEQPAAGDLAATLAKEWNVDEAETKRRLNIVLEEFGKLSPDEQELYDSPKGAQALWKRYESSNKPPAIDRGLSSVSKTEPTYLFTKAQIYAMSDDERRRNHSAVLAAYAQGKVAE
jgi:hypothetical protein